MDAWAKISGSNVQSFKKAEIITEQLINSNETDSDNGERDSGVFDAEITQLLNSVTEDENFN